MRLGPIAAGHERFIHIRQVAPMRTTYIERQKWFPCISCSVSTTQSPSITNSLVAIVHTKPVIADCVQKLVAMATSLSTSGPHLTHDSLGLSKPTTQTASRSVHPFFAGLTTVTDRQTCSYAGREFKTTGLETVK